MPVPDLRPFRGLRYAAPAVADYSAVICPPYDVISSADRAVLAARHPANAVHVELPASYDEAHRLFEMRPPAREVARHGEQPTEMVVRAGEARIQQSPRINRGLRCRS